MEKMEEIKQMNEKYKNEVRKLLEGSQLYQRMKTCNEQREPLFIKKNQLKKELDDAIAKHRLGDIAKKTREIQDIDIQAQALEDMYKEYYEEVTQHRNRGGVLLVDNPEGYAKWFESYSNEAFALLKPLYDELNATYAKAIELNNKIIDYKDELNIGYSTCTGIVGDRTNQFTNIIDDCLVESDITYFMTEVAKKSQEKPYKGSHNTQII